MSLGTRFLSAVAGAQAKDWFKFGGKLGPLFDDDPAAGAAFKYVEEFTRKHGKVPTAKTITEATGLQLVAEEADTAFLFDQLLDRRIRRQMALAGADAQKLLPVSPKDAMAALYKAMAVLTHETISPDTYDFKNAIHTLWPWLVAKWTGDFNAVPFPWPTLQAMSGGTQGGEVVSVVGRTGLGKTWLMLDMALHAWRVTKRPVVFVSLEMTAQKIMERLAAMYTRTPMDVLKNPYTPNLFLKQDHKLKLHDDLVTLEKSNMPPFIVVDGRMATTVDQVLATCYRYQPLVCAVDGAYMLRHPNPRIARHERITENIERLKGEVATGLDLALYASWQFNRDATKLKKDEIAGAEHVGGGDGIPNTSSVVLALFQGDTSNNVEQLEVRKVHVIKGRDGERGSFDIGWDFAKMDFREYDAKAEANKSISYGIKTDDLEAYLGGMMAA